MKYKRPKRSVQASITNLDEIKAFLGPLSKDYTDAELRQLRNEMQAMAEILIDFYLTQKRARDLPSIAF